MTIEEQLKEVILKRYGTMRDFANKIGMSQSTFATILKRGLTNASVSNILAICNELEISADELGDGKIVPISKSKNHVLISEITNMMYQVRTNKSEYLDLTIDGVPVSDNELETLIEVNEITVELIKRKRSHQNDD